MSSALGTKLGLTTNSTINNVANTISSVTVKTGRPDATSTTINGDYLSLIAPRGYYDGMIPVECKKSTAQNLIGGAIDTSKLLLIDKNVGNGEIGNSSKFAVYACGASYGDCSENFFNNLAYNSNKTYKCAVLCSDENKDYVMFYYPKPWIMYLLSWRQNTSYYGYGFKTLYFFKASNDGTNWIDIKNSGEFAFESVAGSGGGGYLRYTGSKTYKYWKMAFKDSGHNASNIEPSLIGLLT